MAHRTEKKGWAIAIVIFMVFAMLLFAAGGIFSAFSNQSSPATQPAAQNAAQPTQVVSYAPDASSVSGLATQAGSCWTNSIAAPYRADAWRCTVGNEIHDPCFAISGTSNLLCGVNPASSTANAPFVLRLSKPLPAASTPSSTPSDWAWAVLLADGTYCTPFTGTRPFAATGEAAYYSCASGNPDEEYIFGDLNSSSSTWTASVGSLSDATSTYPPAITSQQTMNVETVWQ
jgi:hypothetical protein